MEVHIFKQIKLEKVEDSHNDKTKSHPQELWENANNCNILQVKERL